VVTPAARWQRCKPRPQQQRRRWPCLRLHAAGPVPPKAAAHLQGDRHIQGGSSVGPIHGHWHRRRRVRRRRQRHQCRRRHRHGGNRHGRHRHGRHRHGGARRRITAGAAGRHGCRHGKCRRRGQGKRRRPGKGHGRRHRRGRPRHGRPRHGRCCCQGSGRSDLRVRHAEGGPRRRRRQGRGRRAVNGGHDRSRSS